MNRPTPITRADSAALACLVGAQLVGVTYRYLPQADGPSYSGGGDGFDADLAAVVLDFADRSRRIVTWAMLGEFEGLAILSDAASYSGAADEILEANDREAWRVHHGDTIMSVGAAWHVTGDDCPESLWAVRLDFSVGSIVIALGTADPNLDYMPDELVVVFDNALADSYRPRHVSESSWGNRIEPA